MLIVYTYGPIGQCPDMSPFVNKLLTWLRMANVPYQTALGTKRKMPQGKLPTIEDEGHLVADSTTAIRYLERKFGDPLREASLTPEEVAQREAVKALIESNLYWVEFHIRWCGTQANFDLYKPSLRNYAYGTFPKYQTVFLPLLEPFVFRVVRRQRGSQSYAQGMSRRSNEEIMELGIEGWRAVSNFLGEKRFMMGDHVSSLDATAYGFLEGFFSAPFESPVKEFVRKQDNLHGLWSRVREQYWTEH